MKFYFNYLFLVSLLFLWDCKSGGSKEEVVDYSEDGKEGFYTVKDKRNAELLALTQKLENESTSFTGDFKMQIKSGPGLTTTNNLEGKIYFDKPSGKIKIELLMPILGWKLSQILSDGETISVQTMGEPKVHTQPMGDIVIQDPNTRKRIPIPFPVIYHSVTLNFTAGFQGDQTKMNPTEKKVRVLKGTDEYLYVFYDSGLESLEFKSTQKNLQAKCKVPDSAKTGIHPPARMITRVTEITTGNDFSSVDVQYRNMKKVASVPANIFRF
jgi:outer membrane lipoprotein-sorting protein